MAFAGVLSESTTEAICYLATAVSVMESPLTVPALAGSIELLMRMLVLVKQDVKQIFCMPCITISIPHSAVCLQYQGTVQHTKQTTSDLRSDTLSQSRCLLFRRNSKAFQSKANRPLFNRCIGYMKTGKVHMWLGLGGSQRNKFNRSMWGWSCD